MTKYEKIMQMNINEFAKWLKMFTSSDMDWQTFRLWLESDAWEGFDHD